MADMTDQQHQPEEPAARLPASEGDGVGNPANERRASSPRDTIGGALRYTTYQEPGNPEELPATEAIRSELSQVTATTVLMDRSGAEQITAERATLDRSGARTIETTTAELNRSGVVALGSDSASLVNSTAVQIVAEDARFVSSPVFYANARQATFERSRIFVFAGTASGDVNPIMTARGLAAFGAALGATLALLAALARSRRES